MHLGSSYHASVTTYQLTHEIDGRSYTHSVCSCLFEWNLKDEPWKGQHIVAIKSKLMPSWKYPQMCSHVLRGKQKIPNLVHLVHLVHR